MSEQLKYKLVKLVEVQDWDRLVEETYQRPYKFQQQDGCIGRGVITFNVPSEEFDYFENDSIPDEVNGEEMGVSFQAWLKRDPAKWEGKPKHNDKNYIDLFWHRSFYPEFGAVVNDLHAKGLIAAGEYYLHIDW